MQSSKKTYLALDLDTLTGVFLQGGTDYSATTYKRIPYATGEFEGGLKIERLGNTLEVTNPDGTKSMLIRAKKTISKKFMTLINLSNGEQSETIGIPLF